MLLVLIGAGGHARVCLDVARAAGVEMVKLCDPQFPRGARVNEAEVAFNSEEELVGLADVRVLVALGSQSLRRRIMSRLREAGVAFATLVHPTAVISPYAEVGEGTVVMPLAVINANSRVGAGCIVNTSANLDHDNILEEGVQISPGVASAGCVRYGAWASVCTGASLRPGVRVGAGAMVGAGAAVVADVPAQAVHVGVPARPMRP